MSCLIVAVRPLPFCLPIAFTPSPCPVHHLLPVLLPCLCLLARTVILAQGCVSRCPCLARTDCIALSPSHQLSPLGLAHTGLLSCPCQLLLVCAITSSPALSLTHAGRLPCLQCPHPAHTNHGPLCHLQLPRLHLTPSPLPLVPSCPCISRHPPISLMPSSSPLPHHHHPHAVLVTHANPLSLTPVVFLAHADPLPLVPTWCPSL